MIDRNFGCKLIDFGCASEINKQSEGWHEGTTIYNAPEKLRGMGKHSKGEPFSNYKADMFSVGLVF